MANRRNNKQHPLGVVIPIEDEVVEEEQSPPVEDAVTTLVDAHHDDPFDDSFDIYLAIKMPNGETLNIRRLLSRDELERSLPWRRPDVVLQNIVNMGVEITKGLYLGPKPSSEIDEP
jgi:hypothetical protein